MGGSSNVKRGMNPDLVTEWEGYKGYIEGRVTTEFMGYNNYVECSE